MANHLCLLALLRNSFQLPIYHQLHKNQIPTWYFHHSPEDMRGSRNQNFVKDKMVLHIGEAAKISTVSVLGSQMAFDNRIFFGTDPVAMDRIGLDILEKKRMEQKFYQ